MRAELLLISILNPSKLARQLAQLMLRLIPERGDDPEIDYIQAHLLDRGDDTNDGIVGLK